MKPKKRSWSVFLMLTVSGIFGSWMLWKQQQEKQRPRFTDQMNHIMDGITPPEQSSESRDDRPPSRQQPDVTMRSVSYLRRGQFEGDLYAKPLARNVLAPVCDHR